MVALGARTVGAECEVGSAGSGIVDRSIVGKWVDKKNTG